MRFSLLLPLALVTTFPVRAAQAADAGACPSLTLNAHLAATVDQARAAFAATRLEEFQAATSALGALVPCLMEPIDPAVAADVHRMVGLGAFVGREGEHAQQAFAAARSAEPGYVWPEDLVPWGHPILGVYQALAVEGARFASVPAPPAGWVYLDGRPSEPRPLDWPAIFQVSDAEGAIQLTAYLWPDLPLPAYAVASAAEAPASPAPTGRDPLPVTVPASSTVVRRGPDGWALAGAGGAILAAGALYFLADRSADAYWDPATPIEDLEPLRRRTNALVIASAGAGTVAVGTGVLAFLSVRW